MFRQGQRVKLPVKMCDIDAGIPNSPGACAIAQGLRRHFPGVCSVEVGLPEIRFNKGEMRHVAYLDSVGIAGQGLFDQKGAAIKPFKCTITIAQIYPIVKRGTRAERGLLPKKVHRKKENKITKKPLCRRRFHSLALALES